MDFGKIWSITSYEEYVNSYKSTAGPFKQLTSFQRKTYISPEEFFNTQAYLAQQIANDRIGQIIDNVFNSEDLPKNIQSYLKQFTYRAIDYLRINDLIIGEFDRVNTSTYNGGRTDSTFINPKFKVENLIGSAAWRSWALSGIENFYYSYCEQIGVPYLLDPDRFYNKDEIDKFLSEYDQALAEEHSYAEIEITKNRLLIETIKQELFDELGLKQNIKDQKLLQEAIDDEGNPIGEIEDLGAFDEILVLSRYPKNAVITTPENKKRAVLNNDVIGVIEEASVMQSTSDTDAKNAIGRIWGYGIENEINTINEDTTKLKNNVGNISDLTTDNKENLTLALNSTNDKLNLNTNQLWKEINNANEEIKLGKYYIMSFSYNGSNYITPILGSTGREVWCKLVLEKDDGMGIIELFFDFRLAFIWKVTTDYNPNAEEKLIMEIVKKSELSNVKIYEYNGVGFPLPIMFDRPNTVNFTAPNSYWEREYAREKRDLEEAKMREQTAKLADIKPLQDELGQIKPVVEDLKEKDIHRLKALGIHPDFKYYKKNEDK